MKYKPKEIQKNIICDPHSNQLDAYNELVRVHYLQLFQICFLAVTISTRIQNLDLSILAIWSVKDTN